MMAVRWRDPVAASVILEVLCTAHKTGTVVATTTIRCHRRAVIRLRFVG